MCAHFILGRLECYTVGRGESPESSSRIQEEIRMYQEGPGEDQMRSIGGSGQSPLTLCPRCYSLISHKFLVLLFSGFTEAHGVPAVLPISLCEILYAATSKK